MYSPLSGHEKASRTRWGLKFAILKRNRDRKSKNYGEIGIESQKTMETVGHLFSLT